MNSFQAEAVDEMNARAKGYLSPGHGLENGLGASLWMAATDKRTEARFLKPSSGCGLVVRGQLLWGERAGFPGACRLSLCEQPPILNGL